MKKKLTIAIIIGFISLIAGLILAGIGFFSGGIPRLEEISQPEQKHETYKEINRISIDFIPHKIVIHESSDNNYHVSYANSDNNIINQLQVVEKDGHLTLSSKETSFAIEGIMQFLGEQLAQRKMDVYTVTLEIPKGKKLAKLDGHSLSFYDSAAVSLENIQIQEIDLDANLFLKKVEIESGKISANQLYVVQSTFKNTDITVTSYDANLVDTSLENVHLRYYQNLSTANLSLIGENVFSPNSSESLTATNLDLADKSLQDINLSLHTSFDKKALAEHLGYHYQSDEELDEEFINSNYFKGMAENIGIFTKGKYDKLKVTREGDEYNLVLEKKDSKNKLTIDAVNATINLRTPK